METQNLNSGGDPTLAPPTSHRSLIFGILILAGAILVVIGLLFYLMKSKGSDPVTKNVLHNSAGEVLIDRGTDTDHDGLSDVEEKALGTSPTNPDSDNDGLTDEYEVHQSKTDPKNAHSKDPKLTDYQWLFMQSTKIK